jgi:uncharacterized protein (TIGR03435 family)
MNARLSLTLTLAAATAFGQRTAAPTFEVASVKPGGPVQPGRPTGMRGGPGTSDPGQITWIHVTLQDLLVRAYDVKEYQLSGPPWLSTERFDLVAKVPGGTDKEDFQRMLQGLLAERFHLKAHHETQEVAVYELVIAKGGPRFKESPREATESMLSAGDPVEGGPRAPLKRGADGIVELPESMHGKGHITFRWFGGVEIRARRESLNYLIEKLIAELHRPIIDKTGLTGLYDYALAYLPQSMLTSGAPGSLAGPSEGTNRPGAPVDGSTDNRPSDLLTALQGGLGLKLESKKAPGEMVIIDRVDKTPTEN